MGLWCRYRRFCGCPGRLQPWIRYDLGSADLRRNIRKSFDVMRWMGSKQAEKVVSWVYATTCSRSVAKLRTLAPGPGAHLAGSPSGALPPFEQREGEVNG